MLVTADWVLPVSRPPIAHGGVLIEGDRVVAVGSAASLADGPLAGERHDFEGCVLTPGLVNAHTHLVMTAMHGAIPPMPFHEWIARIPSLFRAATQSQIESSIRVGAQQCLRAGVTVVGDIAYSDVSRALCKQAGLGGVFFTEVLGKHAEEVATALSDAGFCSQHHPDRTRCGVSPHAPYTSGPGLLQSAHAFARDAGAPFAVHIAESPAEAELLEHGTGPLLGLATGFAHGFTPPQTTPVRYLHELGVLADAIAIHAVQTDAEDAKLLAREAAGAVLCPRSNAYLHNGAPRAWELHGAGVRLAIGTDSAASNDDLDLLAEVRALAALEPRFAAEQLLRMVTLDAAALLGVDELVGSLDSGKEADLAVFSASGRDPVASVIETGGRDTLRAVMSAGVWRAV